jgi:hypothetical protein
MPEHLLSPLCRVLAALEGRSLRVWTDDLGRLWFELPGGSQHGPFYGLGALLGALLVAVLELS